MSIDDDLAHVAPALRGGHALVLAPWAGATWRAVSQVTVGFVVLLTGGTIAMITVPLFAALITLGVGIPLLAAVLLVTGPLAAVERARLEAQLQVRIAPPVRRRRRPTVWGRMLGVLTDGRRWTAVAYPAVGMLLASVQVIVAWGGFGGSIAAIALPVYRSATELSSTEVTAWVAAGTVGIWVTAWVTQALALAHVRLARALLGPGRRGEVEEARAQVAVAQEEAAVAQERVEVARVRAEHLTETRTRVVGAADTERRRIERDLHDGAQQRLVALGVELGAAKRAAAADPDAAREVIDHAHREVKEVLSELRDLVRGIHPAVLTDRGLDAALSALAARSPVPVEVDVPDVDALAGCTPAAQAAAYFVAAEALTNAARHSGAALVRLDVHVRDGMLHLQVADDGHGGATERPGSGLEGLRGRVEALDGTFHLESPTGHGTRLVVEVPCAS
ncbi:sensor histidine kinase [Cellulomonas sp. P22]|uniref:sensor histidine kinase n=1 Tax=Cellulomonas sp. P22 TaxID=3373189 RepID=UPI00379DAA7A